VFAQRPLDTIDHGAHNGVHARGGVSSERSLDLVSAGLASQGR
jgi:hypothetical protein